MAAVEAVVVAVVVAVAAIVVALGADFRRVRTTSPGINGSAH